MPLIHFISIFQIALLVLFGESQERHEVPSAYTAYPDEVLALSVIQQNNHLELLPDEGALCIAFQGLAAMKATGLIHPEKELITLIDFTMPSTAKRLWVIDPKTSKVLMHTYVAHGQKSGENFASAFSNTPESHQSSLGFYRTGDTYEGKHGLSLWLDGVEEGFNHKARDRYVVMHGAEYVSEDFISIHGRLGRSFGCPAVPYPLHSELIELIQGGSCLFIYYPVGDYLKSSALLNPSLEGTSAN